MAAAFCLVVVAGIFVHRTSSTRYTTEVGEQRALNLADGTQVFLNTNSSIAVRYDERRRFVDLTRGEALFEVAKRQPNRPFVVMVGGRRITALGTAFLVKMDRKRGLFLVPGRDPGSDSEQLQITLLEGKIAVSGAEDSGEAAVRNSGKPLDERQPGEGNPSNGVVLDPGQRLTLAVNRRPQLDRPNLEKVTAWRSGRVEFDKISLASAVVEMNRYSATKLVIEQPEAAGLIITGTFRAGAAASFAQAIAAAYRLEIIEKANRIVLAGRPESTAQPAALPVDAPSEGRP